VFDWAPRAELSATGSRTKALAMKDGEHGRKLFRPKWPTA